MQLHKHTCSSFLRLSSSQEFRSACSFFRLFIKRQFLRVADTTPEERLYLTSLTPQYFIASLVDMQNAVPTGEFNVYLRDLNSTTGDRGTLHANVNYLKTLSPTTNIQPQVESFSVLQSARNKMGDQELKQILR